jgi:hypothetical protein
MDFHWLFGKRVKVKELITGFLQAGRRRETFQPPFSQESFSFGFHLNNLIERDHRSIKLRLGPMLG